MQRRDVYKRPETSKEFVGFKPGPGGQPVPVFRTVPKKPLTGRTARYGGCGEPVLIRPAGQ